MATRNTIIGHLTWLTEQTHWKVLPLVESVEKKSRKVFRSFLFYGVHENARYPCNTRAIAGKEEESA